MNYFAIIVTKIHERESEEPTQVSFRLILACQNLLAATVLVRISLAGDKGGPLRGVWRDRGRGRGRGGLSLACVTH